MIGNSTQEWKVNLILKKCEEIHKEAMSKYSVCDMVPCISKWEEEHSFLERLLTFLTTNKGINSTLIKTIQAKLKVIQTIKTEYYWNWYHDTSDARSEQRWQEKGETTEHYLIKLLNEKPNMSYKEIFVNNDDIIKQWTDFSKKCYWSHLKTVIWYGPKGNGKSLYARAFANATQSKFIQIDSLKFLNQNDNKVNTWVNLAKTMGNVVVYIKNIESLIEAKNSFLFIMEKFCEKKEGKNICIMSCSSSPKKLPIDLFQKFYYNCFVEPASKQNKVSFIYFLAKKLNITVELSKGEENGLNERLGNYSNEDLKKILLLSRDFKMGINYSQNNQSSDKLTLEDLKKAMNIVPESITLKVRQEFNMKEIFSNK